MLNHAFISDRLKCPNTFKATAYIHKIDMAQVKMYLWSRNV